eukprot:scaffold109806_cov13-Tisochrysis_lutea.AAC.1
MKPVMLQQALLFRAPWLQITLIVWGPWGSTMNRLLRLQGSRGSCSSFPFLFGMGGGRLCKQLTLPIIDAWSVMSTGLDVYDDIADLVEGAVTLAQGGTIEWDATQ